MLAIEVIWKILVSIIEVLPFLILGLVIEQLFVRWYRFHHGRCLKCGRPEDIYFYGNPYCSYHAIKHAEEIERRIKRYESK